ncbi:MAG: hypothetical protein NTZ73_04375 [Candidatus Diapherotrites archaeon]|nr:hypothetical protein [Candidatus Diapherotrites archaeon]
MVFSNIDDCLVPSEEEIKSVKKLARNCPELLDSRELWILEYVSENSEDDFDDEVVE